MNMPTSHFIKSVMNNDKQVYLCNANILESSKDYFVDICDNYIDPIWKLDLKLKSNEQDYHKHKILGLEPDIDEDDNVIGFSKSNITICDKTNKFSPKRFYDCLKCDKLIITGSRLLEAENTRTSIECNDLIVTNPYALGNLSTLSKLSIKVSNSILLKIPFVGLIIIDSLWNAIKHQGSLAEISIDNMSILGSDLDKLYDYVCKFIEHKLKILKSESGRLLGLHVLIRIIDILYRCTNDKRYIAYIKDFGDKYIFEYKRWLSTQRKSDYTFLKSMEGTVILERWHNNDVNMIDNYKKL